MSINKEKIIVVVQTDKGYVAIELNIIFDAWRKSDINQVLKELKNRYPKYKILVYDDNKVQFSWLYNNIKFVTNQVISKYKSDSQLIEEINRKRIKTISNFNMKELLTSIKILNEVNVDIPFEILHLGFCLSLELFSIAEEKINENIGNAQKTIDELSKLKSVLPENCKNLLSDNSQELRTLSRDILKRFKDQENHIECY